MRIHVTGNSGVGALVSDWIGRTSPFVLHPQFPSFTLNIQEYTEQLVSVDTPDGPLEDQIVDRLREQAAFAPGIGRIRLDAEGGNQDPKLLVLRVPQDFSEQQQKHIARAIFHALLTVAGQDKTAMPWDQRKKQPIKMAVKRAKVSVRKNARGLAVVGLTAAAVFMATALAFGQTVRQGAAGTQAWLFECTTGCIGSSVTANQGTPAADANAWPIKVTFGGATIDPRLITVNSWFGSSAPTVGIKANAASIPVVISNEQFVAQGSTTAGQLAPLVQCAVTDSVPVFTTLTTRPCTMNTSGRLRADVTSATGLNTIAIEAQGFSFGPITANGSTGAAAVAGGQSYYAGIVPTAFTGTLTIVADNGTETFEVPFIDDAGVARTSKTLSASSTNEFWSLLWPNGAVQVAIITSGYGGGSTDVVIQGAGANPTTLTWLGSVAPTVGQKTMTDSLPVVVASNQTAIPISAASLPLPTGAATEATLGTRLADATFTARVPAALVGGRFDTNTGAWLGSTAPTVGQKTMANSVPVVLPSDQTVAVSVAATLTVQGAKTNDGAAPGATNIGTLPAVATAAAPTYTEGRQVAASTDLAAAIRMRTANALTAASPTAATVGVASAQAVAANAVRRGLLLVNNSINTISCAFGAAAVLSSGLTLESGAAYTMNEYSFHVGAVNCIASAASSNLSIQEFSN
jgi:hypothetical protein